MHSVVGLRLGLPPCHLDLHVPFYHLTSFLSKALLAFPSSLEVQLVPVLVVHLNLIMIISIFGATIDDEPGHEDLDANFFSKILF